MANVCYCDSSTAWVSSAIPLSYTTTTSTSYTINPVITYINNRQDIIDEYKSQYRSDLYTCDYCGAEYKAEEGGFIPPCNGCGARLRRLE